MTGELLAYLNEHRQDMIAMLQQLVGLESPSGNKEALDRLVRFLAVIFEKVADRVEVIEQAQVGDFLKVTTGQGKGQILALCHMDTVWPQGEIRKRPWRIEGNRAYGPGVLDQKPSFVQAYWVLQAFRSLGIQPQKKVVILCNSDEESGSLNSRGWIEAEARKSEAVLVLEPSGPGGAAKTERKGVYAFILEITGVATHAGMSLTEGVNAVTELALQILKLQALNNPATGTSVVVGPVSGGMRRATVPDRARAEIDLRCFDEADGRKVEEKILNLKPVLAGANLKIVKLESRPSLKQTPANRALYEQAKGLAKEIGFDLGRSAVGGGSDGNFTSAQGIATLDGLGLVGDGSHSLGEFVELESLVSRTALVARLLQTL